MRLSEIGNQNSDFGTLISEFGIPKNRVNPPLAHRGSIDDGRATMISERIFAGQPTCQIDDLDALLIIGCVMRTGDEHFGIGIADGDERRKLAFQRGCSSATRFSYRRP